MNDLLLQEWMEEVTAIMDRIIDNTRETVRFTVEINARPWMRRIDEGDMKVDPRNLYVVWK